MARTTQTPVPVPSLSPTGLTSLGETILLDHDARKSPPRAPLAVGDTVVISTDSPHAPTGRWAGAPSAGPRRRLCSSPMARSSGCPSSTSTNRWRPILRTCGGVLPGALRLSKRPRHCGLAGVAASTALLHQWQFIPARRILKAAGTDQQLTYQNTYVLPSPQDSRAGILTTLGHMTEIYGTWGRRGPESLVFMSKRELHPWRQWGVERGRTVGVPV